MKVLKFGGTSVANAANIKKVRDILINTSATTKVAVVVSAMGGVTDLLQQVGEKANKKDSTYRSLLEQIKKRHLDTATQLQLPGSSLKHLEILLGELASILEGVYLINEFSNKTRDKVLSFGELLSSYIISEMIYPSSISVALKDSRELIITDSNFTQAEVIFEQTKENSYSYFNTSKERITILPGFVARNTLGETTTLGRGGSDYTAALIAAAVHAAVLEIWTDVSGMYTANPSLVSQAFPIKEISYHEAMELSHFGAKVLYPPTIRPVLQKRIPIRIKNTFSAHDEGTLITSELSEKNGPVKGITHLDKIALLTIEGNGMVGVPGVSKRLFEALSLNTINVILITQASSEHSICVAIKEQDVEMAIQAINNAFKYEISLGEIQPVIVEKSLAIVAVIGDKMKNHQGISGKMFEVLGNNNVNIRAIAQGASERNISAVISKKDVKKALSVLHYRFFEKQVKSLHLFITGVGSVGSKLLGQIQQQHSYLLEHLQLNIKVVGVCNSRNMVFHEAGIDLDSWQESLENGSPYQYEQWFDQIKAFNLPNSIFVDITASEAVAMRYENYLKESIAVVACNKIACSSVYSNYKNLKSLSKKYNAPFLFETNVGAGLPVINTLANLINSGDQINEIQAVLSGSLNFIFNNFNEDASFYEVVQQAKEEGYTEPDPRIDLSGVDVARKILILARESGVVLDMDAIENNSFLPDASLKAASVPAFFETLKNEAVHFEKLVKEAHSNQCRLKYVASFKEGKASVGLQQIPAAHPFYNLDGKDNIVLFYTSRYVDQPLIIKGAGAGAEVTASGLFGDIISLKNN